ncbi:MAG: hypothetical protein WDZ59_07600 [Pirellulales bacterium]
MGSATQEDRVLVLPYDPGRLPTMHRSRPGESIQLDVLGLPPFKDTSFSIRNPKHRHYTRFLALRTAALEAMGDRAWSHGPIGLDFDLFASAVDPRRDLLDYVSGVMDTLDGSHGMDFSYLPIVYNDDFQVCEVVSRFHQSASERYVVRITFLPNKSPVPICSTPPDRYGG